MEADVDQFNKDRVAMATFPKTSQLAHSVIERATLLLCMNIEPGRVSKTESQPVQGTVQRASFVGECRCTVHNNVQCVCVISLLAAVWIGCYLYTLLSCVARWCVFNNC